MKEDTKSNSTARVKYFDYIIGVMRESDEFLHKNAEETCNEVLELMNEAINCMGAIKIGSKNYYVERSMAFFLLHILMPFSYAIYVDLLMGNLPVCFMELRLMIESLGKCYLADLKRPDRAFFQEKLEFLERELNRENVSMSNLMKELGRTLGLENEFIALWDKLSRDWVHIKGIMDKTVDQVIQKSDVPPWALPLPMSYTVNDLDAINELCKRISQFRSLLTSTVEKYEQELAFL